MKKYDLNRDFVKFKHIKPPIYKPLLPVMNFFLRLLAKCMRSSKSVSLQRRSIKCASKRNVPVIILTPKNAKAPLPCLVYFHGGGFMLCGAPCHYRLACEYAQKTPCVVIIADYALSPKNVFPTAVNDCFEVLKWTAKNADTLNINVSKIAVGGDSAGGNLAAASALMARDRRGPFVCFQMLVYPVVDRRLRTESMRIYDDTPLWNSVLNKKMWKYYLGGKAHENIEYASPLEAKSLCNMPSAYVETAQYDCLHDEGVEYASALIKAGVKAELNQTVGTVHGFDILAGSQIVKECVKRRVGSLQNAFYDSKR